jgi:hypothetical protein
MSSYLNTVYAEIRSHIVSALPAVAPDGVFELEQIEAIPYEDLTLPYAVITLGNEHSDPDYGSANKIYSADLIITLVFDAEADCGVVRPYGEALRDFLLSVSPTNYQVIDTTSLDWSAMNEPNKIFIVKNYPQRAVLVTLPIIFGEQAA